MRLGEVSADSIVSRLVIPHHEEPPVMAGVARHCLSVCLRVQVPPQIIFETILLLYSLGFVRRVYWIHYLR